MEGLLKVKFLFGCFQFFMLFLKGETLSTHSSISTISTSFTKF